MLTVEKVQTPLGEVYYENGILFSVFNIKNPSMEDADKHLELVKANFGQFDLSLNIADSRTGSEMNKTIRDYLANSDSAAFTKATAVLIASGAQKIMANLFLQFFKPKYEIKIFTDKDKAIEWLNKFK